MGGSVHVPFLSMQAFIFHVGYVLVVLVLSLHHEYRVLAASLLLQHEGSVHVPFLLCRHSFFMWAKCLWFVGCPCITNIEYLPHRCCYSMRALSTSLFFRCRH